MAVHAIVQLYILLECRQCVAVVVVNNVKYKVSSTTTYNLDAEDKNTRVRSIDLLASAHQSHSSLDTDRHVLVHLFLMLRIFFPIYSRLSCWYSPVHPVPIKCAYMNALLFHVDLSTFFSVCLCCPIFPTGSVSFIIRPPLSVCFSLIFLSMCLYSVLHYWVRQKHEKSERKSLETFANIHKYCVRMYGCWYWYDKHEVYHLRYKHTHTLTQTLFSLSIWPGHFTYNLAINFHFASSHFFAVHFGLPSFFFTFVFATSALRLASPQILSLQFD